MEHTMESVMRAVLVSRADGKPLPVLTSNQCHALAQELNKLDKGYQQGCCCPPPGYQGLWAAGMCPVHQGLRRAKP